MNGGNMYKVKLTYYKSMGKYYTDSSYESECVDMYDIWEEVQEKQKAGTLPGIGPGTGFTSSKRKGCIISVEVPNHPHNHPRLLL